MAKTYDNIRIYGDLDSGVWVAPKGTEGPADLDAPTGFEELGWLSEDGISFERSEDATTHRAYQGATIVRRKKTSVEDSFTFQCLEETAETLGLYYSGQTPVVTGTGESAIATITVADQARSDERAFVVDVVDGDVVKRYVIPSATVSGGTVAHSNADMTVYEFTGTIQGDYTIITNSPGVVA
jgi:hypothetical protein